MTKNEIRLGRITEFSLCALVFTLPFSKSMVEISFSCALVSWFLTKICRYKNRPGPIKIFKPYGPGSNIPIYLFIFAALLSTLASASFFLSVKGFFFKLLEWVLLYFIVIEVIDSKPKFNRVLAAMLLSMALVGVDGLYQYVTGVDFLRGYSSGGGRVIQGPFTVRNSLAGWLVIMIPIAFSLIYLKKNKLFGPLAWLLTGILTVCMVLTYSRGALASVLLALIFFSVFKKRKALLITMILLLFLSLAFSNYMKTRVNSMVAVPAYDRIGLWEEALGIIEDFPVLGCGLNTYAAVGPLYRVSGGGGCYPHNSYLQMAAESGLLGLIAFSWILVGLFGHSLSDIAKIINKPYGTILLGLSAGLFGFLIHSFVDVNIYTLQLGNLMWFIMALIVSAHTLAVGGLKPIG